jgi:hypothetical protein
MPPHEEPLLRAQYLDPLEGVYGADSHADVDPSRCRLIPFGGENR